MAEPIDKEYYEVIANRSIAEKLLVRARNKMHADFLRLVRPSAETTILDVGVSDVQVKGANWLESVYAYPAKISACGLGKGGAFKAAFPEINYTTIVPNERLPYPDSAFDVVTANAVLEHVGSVANQRAFVAELSRVGRLVFLTVPHRYFPIEHHTSIPFLHFFDRSFALACTIAGKERWLKPENLIMMSRAHLRSLAPANSTIGYTGIGLGPFSSNLFLYSQNA
ncbi:methyltransferase domain-containing protein [Aurantimonas aggregata]|uniref:Methyltransferase domain-containing protein n=1 Tax=Aurantimonas aggregata TaxID=2047720 RepID=A0A6L9MKA0_9HYPH|nr:methyltransferase domain-containing protein [Aurantimonas aggregata]NDV87920.1 methyltransferase domain-containing protein [Aurantimonas aggregata]